MNSTDIHDTARRLDTLTSPAGQFAYDYHLAGRKVENLLLPTGGRIANNYVTDPLARLKGTWLLNSAEQTLNYHGYEHNLRNDITRHTRTDASSVDYDYDDLSQLTDAVGRGSGVREAPREVGDVLECDDGVERLRRFSSGCGADALDERSSGIRKR